MAHFQDVIELRRQRANIATQMKDVMDVATSEKRSLNAEENQKLDRMIADEKELRSQIERLEAFEDVQASLSGHENRFKADQREQSQGSEYRDVFKKWIIGGTEQLGSEERNILFANRNMEEQRALGIGTNAGGGFTVPQGFYDQLIEAQKAVSPVRNAGVFTLSTDSGNALMIPTANSTAEKGRILAEHAAATTSDPSFAQASLGAYKYTSDIVLVSLELLQDSAFDIEAYVAKLLGNRIGRINNEHFTTGTGTAQPQGIVTGAVLGKTGATGQTTSITVDDLVDLEHSVNSVYRKGAKFMLADSSLKAIKKLKDSQGRHLWLPGIAYKEPDTVLGYNYVVNDDMPTMAANAKSIVFGALENYWIRDVKAVQIIRFNEKYMENGQIGFVAFSRADGKMINAGTNPVAYYQNSAT